VGLRPLGDTGGWHEHGYEKMLYCVRGQIVFRAVGGGIEFGPGNNMVLLRFTAPGRFLPIWTARDQGVR
jgi:quercetin dioxygenase-like cupin family protein